MSGLYVHIPFCAKKCAYCDFVSYGGRERFLPLYLSRLKEEAASFAGAAFDTVFIGGGTPSLLSAEEITDLMAFLRRTFMFRQDAEITIEANPASVTKAKVEAWKTAGINRVSMGAQALSDEVLSSIGRCHTLAQLEEAISLVKAEGFDSFNLDLICALPGQTLSAWQKTLDDVCRYAPDHISCYSLILEGSTPMAKAYAAGKIVLPSEEEERAMVHLAEKTLAERGYTQYEISNFARPGKECRHNINYWECGEYLGLGCAAHSYWQGERYHNVNGLDAYLAGALREDAEMPDASAQREERLMLGLRMNRGMDVLRFNRDFGCDFAAEYAKPLRRNLDRGLIGFDGAHLFLTPRGRDFCDTVVLDFM